MRRIEKDTYSKILNGAMLDGFMLFRLHDCGYANPADIIGIRTTDGFGVLLEMKQGEVFEDVLKEYNYQPQQISYLKRYANTPNAYALIGIKLPRKGVVIARVFSRTSRPDLKTTIFGEYVYEIQCEIKLKEGMYRGLNEIK